MLFDVEPTLSGARMHITFTDEEVAFRDEVRSFFRKEMPQDIVEKQRLSIPLDREDYIRFQKALYDKGWAGINWPVEYGGTGWTTVQKYIFGTEMADADAPGIIPFGLGMVGPVIYTFGSEAQKKRFLPDILASNVWWCQGYSEPGSGSDLASLRTRADLNGDHYVVNGTKTWTTLGQYADWIFCLVRTTTDVARRQEGISFLLIEMSSPGVSVKPIITMDGAHEINEIHFENVSVPADNLVGEEGKGWTYGKVLLQHERTGTAGVAATKHRLAKLRAQAATSVRGVDARRGRIRQSTRTGIVNSQTQGYGNAAGRGRTVSRSCRLLCVALCAGPVRARLPGRGANRFRGGNQDIAALFQLSQGLYLQRLERDSEKHHRQARARSIGAVPINITLLDH
jgi:alkylation response protein AidB-like acyl-CoA dehydrogenase